MSRAGERPFKASTVNVYGEAEQEDHGGVSFLRLPIWIGGNEIDAYLEDVGAKAPWEAQLDGSVLLVVGAESEGIPRPVIDAVV